MHQFLFALTYQIGHLENDDYQIGEVLCEEPFICMFKLHLDNDTNDTIVTLVVENNGVYRYATNDWTYIEESVQEAFTLLSVEDDHDKHVDPDGFCFADSITYYLEKWPLRTMTWDDVIKRKHEAKQ
jgi:hypothetical protein